MTEDELKRRTKDFSLRIIRLVRALPKSMESRVIGQQILRSGTSLAANYHAACRGRSDADFVAKLGLVVEEADETLFWLDLILEAKLIEASMLQDLRNEADQLVAIMVASWKTARKKTDKGTSF